ncbi:MAG: transcription antitermination factor NusB [Candidatus Saccharicenans sp.]|uniref:transcription antitermination factor NusB n=1 Tax=Candidatus Saccharicenans sp. TaxID=2819258 RepID=UPI00404B9196
MGKRRKARECALQILFQLEFSGDDLLPVLKDYWARQNVPAETREYSEWLVRGICEHRAEIDRAIQQASRHWRLERMATVDRNILRIAVFEMLYEKNLAPSIIMDEAIEIAKKYSGQEAANFVNGILDGVNRRLQNPPPPDKS